MVFAGFFISSARYVSVTVESTPPPEAVFVTGNFDVSAATLVYQDHLLVTPTDIEFKTDGTKLFVSLQGSSNIYEYSISTAWDLTTISADATTSLSVSNMSQVQTIDFNRTGTKLYACGSGNVAEFSMTSAYDLTTAGSQSTLDINVYSGTTIYGACFSNSVSNNYLHFTSSNINHVNTISTIELEDPLSGSTFLGRSANVVPMLSNVVAPDLHTTRTLEVSGGGSRMYQIYRNTDLSNVYVIEYKLGTPHDASTLTSATQIEDYFDLATQTGGTALYDTFNSLKIKPDGTEMFLSGTNLFGNELSDSTGGNEFMGHSRNLTYVTTGYWPGSGNGILYIYKYDEDNETFALDQSISTIDGNILYQNEKRMSNDGNLLVAPYPGGGYFTINQYNGSSWSTLLKHTSGNPPRWGENGIDMSTSENLVVVAGTNQSKFAVASNNAGTWSATEYTLPDSGPNSISITDETFLAIGSVSNTVHSSGVVYFYSNVNGTWTYADSVVSPDSGSTQFAYQGAMELNGDSTVLAVGAYAYSSNKGRVYTYENSGGSWSLTQTIDNPNGTAADYFGKSVSINGAGTRIVVGAYAYSSNKGRVYVFDKLGTTWTLTSTINTPTTGNKFGTDVQISTDGSRMAARETSTMRYYTSPKNTQTYSLDIPRPVLYISGDQDDVYDILSTSANVTATGSGVFTQDTSFVKVGSGSLDFDGATSMIVSSDVPEFVGTIKLSFSMWFRPDVITTAASDRDCLFASNTYHETNSGFGFALYTYGGQGDSKAYFELWSEYATSLYVAYTWNTNVSNTDWVSGVWRHVAIVLDGDNLPKCYFNGEELTNGAYTSGSSWSFTGVSTGGRPQFGAAGALTNTYYDGKLDDIKVFNSILPEKTVKKIYLDGLAPAKTQAFHLTFEDNTGADILPSGASLGGTAFTTLQSNAITYQGDYVGDFTDANSNVQVTNWSTFDTPFTFSFWVYLTAPSGRNSTDFVHSSNIYETGKVGFMYQLASASDPYEIGVLVRTTTSLSLDTAPTLYSLDNRWSHHVGTYDGSTFNTYLDGVNILSFSVSADITTGQDLLFMKGYPFSPTDIRKPYGYLDDLRVYDYVLSPVEVEYLYTSTVIHTNQIFYLSYDQSNVYDYHAGTANVTATGTGVYYQDPGSKIGTHSGQYPQGSTGTVVPTWSDLTTTTVLTFGLWAFPTVLTGTHTLFATENFGSGTTGIGAQLVNSGGNLQVRLLTRVSSTDRYRYITLTNVSNYTNKWTYFVFIYNIAAADSKIIVNGAVQTLTGSETWSFSGVPAGDDMRIGNYNGTSTNEFSGALDDFRVFKRELNAHEVAALYLAYTQTRIYSLQFEEISLPQIQPIDLDGVADIRPSGSSMINYSSVPRGRISNYPQSYSVVSDTLLNGNTGDVFDITSSGESGTGFIGVRTDSFDDPFQTSIIIWKFPSGTTSSVFTTGGAGYANPLIANDTTVNVSLTNTGKLKIINAYTSAASTLTSLDSTATVSLTDWNHTALVVDDANSIAHLYMNGVFQVSLSGISGTGWDKIFFFFDRETPYYDEYFLQSIKVYGEALTAAEILYDYNNA